jgi:DNA-binding GntR family transcriptional regulator
MRNRMPLAMLEADRRTTREQVHEALRRGILGGTLEVGTRLIQTDIAEALGVSTTPVREALRDLAAEGLVRFDDYRGAVVQSPNLADIREIYGLRIVLEPVALRQSLETLPDDELGRATHLQTLMDEERDLGVWVELNNQFHAVFDDSRSPRMNAILRNLRDSAALVVGFSNRVRPTLIDASNRQHHNLLGACRDRDGDAAARIVEEHVRETLEAMERYFSEASEPQASEPQKPGWQPRVN